MATEKVNGSQSVSKDLTVGGKATVRNSAQFDRNVKVSGWLEAPNIKGAYVGLFNSAEDLNKEYPKPKKGWYALVADLSPLDDGEKATDLSAAAAVYAVNDSGEWQITKYSSSELNDYVQQVEDQLDAVEERVKESIPTTLSELENDGDYVTRKDVVNYDGSDNKNGVMSYGMAAQLDRLHRASAHISGILEGEWNILSGKPSGTVRAIYYLSDMKTFAASTSQSDTNSLYGEWDENEGDGFQASTQYLGTSGPLQKLYFCGSTAYFYDDRKGKMNPLGRLWDYVDWDSLGSETTAGIVQILAEHGLGVNNGVVALSLATTSSDGAMSAEDKAKLDTFSATGEATSEESGMMSADDKVKLDCLSQGIPFFTGILDAVVSPLNTVLADVFAVYFVTDQNRWLAQASDGRYYTQWSASGPYLDNSYYTKTADRAYNSGGVLYRYDELSDTLVKWCDMSMYLSKNVTATEEEAGSMSAQDKRRVDFMSKLILGGMMTNGTMRFDTYCSTENANGTLDEKTQCHDWDGIIYFCDRKLFAAYKETDRLTDNCGNAVAYFTFYTHWDTAHLYMKMVGHDGGLWKEKVYIHAKHLYQWNNCAEGGTGQLELAGGGADYEIITEEEIDEIFADFQFVAPGDVTGLTSVELRVEEPLVPGEPEYNGEGGVILPLSITEVSEEEVDDITGKESD